MSSEKRRLVAARAFKDVLGQIRNEEPKADAPASLDGRTLALLLAKNFERLDNGRDGITKEDITAAMLMKQQFSDNEYLMLQLMGRYFDTMANMSDDEAGKETVITSLDIEVLNQFLVHSNLSLEELHSWRAQAADPEV